MKIAAFSDTHGCVELPRDIDKDTDVICIAGDIVPLDIQRNEGHTWTWLEESFMRWCEEMPVRHIVFIAGNHDVHINDKNDRIYEMIWNHGLEGKVIYLQDGKCEIDGMTFYGTPWVKDLPRWAFNTDHIGVKLSKIPMNCDVLITHIPPKYMGVGDSHYPDGLVRSYGSEELTEVLMRRSVKVNICGHVHTGVHGGVEIKGKYNDPCMIYNVSMINEGYFEEFPVTYINI